VNGFDTIAALLRDRQQFVDDIRQRIDPGRRALALLIGSTLLFALYGAIVGAAHSSSQALAAAIKLPVLYLLTALICLPTLYIFNVFFGSKLLLTQHVLLVLTSTTIISLLLFSFAPVTFFFLTTGNSYEFYKLLNVAIFAITGLIGVRFFYQGMRQIAALQDTENLAARMRLLTLWVLLYAFVGSQLGWTIRPIFGEPGQPFILFSAERGTIYMDLARTLGELLRFR
jgi:hypothetical protein